MGKPSPPTPPDPVAVSAAQTQSNEATAALQAQLNNVNQYSPYGSVTYDQYAPNQWSQTTTLSPSQQAIYNQQTAAEQGALQLGNTQLGRIGTALGTQLNPSNLATAPST